MTRGCVDRQGKDEVGCKPPPAELADQLGRSTSASPCSSSQPSPRGTSSFPSSGSSSQITLGGGGGVFGGCGEGSSLIPWLKTLSTGAGASSSKFPAHYSYFGGGSISAPPSSKLILRIDLCKKRILKIDPWIRNRCVSGSMAGIGDELGVHICSLPVAEILHEFIESELQDKIINHGMQPHNRVTQPEPVHQLFSVLFRTIKNDYTACEFYQHEDGGPPLFPWRRCTNSKIMVREDGHSHVH
uniref:Protein BZR1 homolog n=1 Tax=Oryza brachyantha TaxID=4533 RepID=J3LB57_ORYBR